MTKKKAVVTSITIGRPRKSRTKTALQLSHNEVSGKLQRARDLFAYLNVDASEVIDGSAPLQVFIQLKEDLKKIHEMSKLPPPEITKLWGSDPVVMNKMKKHPTLKKQFTLRDLADFVWRMSHGG